ASALTLARRAAVAIEVVAPGKDTARRWVVCGPLLEPHPTPCRLLPFCFRGQPLPGPGGVGVRIFPIDVDDRTPSLIFRSVARLPVGRLSVAGCANEPGVLGVRHRVAIKVELVDVNQALGSFVLPHVGSVGGVSPNEPAGGNAHHPTGRSWWHL